MTQSVYWKAEVTTVELPANHLLLAYAESLARQVLQPKHLPIVNEQ